MYAEVGDRIVMGRDPGSVLYRAGEIIDCRQPDGGPPYVVRWDHDGSEVILFPSPEAFFLCRSIPPSGQPRDDRGAGTTTSPRRPRGVDQNSSEDRIVSLPHRSDRLDPGQSATVGRPGRGRLGDLSRARI